MRIMVPDVNPPWGTGNRAARFARFFFPVPSRAALLRIIINKPLASLAPAMKMVIVFKCIAHHQASEHEVRAGLTFETAETAHLLRF